MKLHSMLSDGMVLQRNAPVKIWGTAGSDQTIELSFLGKAYSTKADSQGNWRVVLDRLEPGGPYEMLISGEREQLTIRDIFIGDVWVLGGQSNMELPVRRTLDLLADEVKDVSLPLIRQFAVPQTYNFHEPQQEISGGKWIAAEGEKVLDFSAVGFFFAREIFEKYQVPIGLIQTAVGGTPIEAWLSEPSLRDIGGYEAILEQCKNDDMVRDTIRKEEQNTQAWYRHLNDTDLGLKEGWFADSCDTSQWSDILVPCSWAGSELEKVRGAVWFRKEIEVPASWLERDGEIMLKLGTIVDADDTYINGVLIGNTGYMYPPRRYLVPKGILKAGINTIAVRVISTQNIGAFVKDMPYKLVAGQEELDLSGGWKYRIGTITEPMKGQTFFQYMPSGVYNGMIAPLSNCRVKGVLWYQGESNTGQPSGYSDLFTTLVQDWRRNWGSENSDFPFLFTQLASFGEEDASQVNWAKLREEQRKSLEVPNTAMAVTIDVGEYNDLHPQDKKTVGQRLALCARRLAYGELGLVYSGPIYKRVERVKDTLVVYFDHVGSGLATRHGEELKGFAICGVDGQFIPATAEICGDTVVVKHQDIRKPVHVRYAWANNPAGANLYNRDGLPASPFTSE